MVTRVPSAALIIGFTIQGLAIARALSHQGVHVYALVQESTRVRRLLKHPVFYTHHCEFLFARSLSGDAIVSSLLEVRAKISAHTVVLYAANDLTVLALSRNWLKLDDHYAVSWSECRHAIEMIVDKSNLPRYCELAGIAYPQTVLIDSREDLMQCTSILSAPYLVKPSTQAAAFKAKKCPTGDELRDFVDSAPPAVFPLVAQQWIEGADSDLWFYSCLADRGQDVAGLSGRKVRSSPPGLGIATVLETADSAELRDTARLLLREFGISGPVAMEFKRDATGILWFIEANVGRTEYCVDLSICAGLNLPYLEYCQATGAPLPAATKPVECVWFDTDKEPFCYLNLCLAERRMRPHEKKPVFPYFGRERPIVQIAAAIEIARKFWNRLIGKVRQKFS